VDRRDEIRVVAREGVRRAELAGERQPVVVQVDGDDRRGAGHDRGHHGSEADRTGTE
jgi:hypothetical protein